MGFATHCNNGPWADWNGLGAARILKSAVLANYTTYQPVLSLNGLNPTHKYDLYIASLQHDNNKPADWLVGATVGMSNNPGGATDWFDGRIAHLANLIPQPDGTMVVKAKCGGDWDGIVLSGFQVQDMGVRGVNPEATPLLLRLSPARVSATPWTVPTIP